MNAEIRNDKRKDEDIKDNFGYSRCVWGEQFLIN